MFWSILKPRMHPETNKKKNYNNLTNKYLMGGWYYKYQLNQSSSWSDLGFIEIAESGLSFTR